MSMAAEVLRGPGVEAVGWALLHFLWQGLILAAALAGLMRWFLPDSPRIRYGVGVGALVVMAALPVLTGFALYRPDIAGFGETNGTDFLKSVASPSRIFSEAPSVAPTFAVPASPEPTIARQEYVPAAPRRTLAQQGVDAWLDVRQSIAPFVPWAAWLWTLGVVAVGIRHGISWVEVRRLRTIGVAPAPEQVTRAVAVLSARLKIGRAVACLESARVRVPATVGWLKPVVLLPASTLAGLEPAQLEAILAHELAHIRRHDYLVNLLQTMVETLLFYHPAVWWLSSQIRLERELCCDDLVVQSGTDPVHYVEALAAVAQLRVMPGLALGATGSSLLTRVRRLAQSEPPPQQAGRGWASVVVLLSLIAALSIPNLSALLAATEDDVPGARNITFPDWTMGQLMIRPWGSDRDTEWEPYQPAMGTVNVPEAMEVQLVMDNSAVTDLSPLGYLGAQDLQSINFRRTEVQDDQLAYIEGMELRELNFELTRITNEGLQYLDDMSTLESLSVGRTNVNNEGMPYLRELTALRQLDLNLTGVDDTGLANLENLTQLEYLDLWNAHITDESLAWIGRLAGLETLGLEGTRITDEGVALLRNLVNMRDINLQSTPITDDGIRELAAMSNLENLNIRSTRATEAIVDFIVSQFDLQRYSLPMQISPAAFSRMEGRPRYHAGRRKLEVHVQEQATGKPIPDARVEMKWRNLSESATYSEMYFWSDENGDFSFYGTATHTADLVAYAPGYVSASLPWETGQTSSITLTMRPASSIGGVVVNESGAPVENVSVHLPVPGEREHVYDTISKHAEQSDNEGRWQCQHAPRDLATLSLELKHPDYIATTYGAAELSAARLRNSTARLVIRRGIEVEGTVIDEAGAPIAGATLIEVEHHRHGRMAVTANTTRTDGEGKFRFENQEVGSISLKINAGGYLPAIESVNFQSDGDPFSFTLKRGGILRGRVETLDGSPIEGVRIEIPHNTGNGGTTDALMADWKTVTDRDGRFLWDEAPEEAVSLRFTKRGYAPVQRTATAGEEDVIVVMGKPLIVSGSLTDSRTGAKIPDVLLTVQSRSSSQEVSPVGDIHFNPAPPGAYRIPLNEWFRRDGTEAYQLTFQVAGYEPVTSRWVSVDEGDVRLDFAFQRSSDFTGIVVDRDGKPVPGAAVYAMRPRFGTYAYVSNNGPLDLLEEETVSTSSDDNGVFSIRPGDWESYLLITSEHGYVLTKPDWGADERQPFELSAWGALSVRVPENFSIQDEVLSMGQESDITVGKIRTHAVEYDQWDIDGRHARAARVIPGEYLVQCQLPVDENTLVATYEHRFLSVEAGGSGGVDMGGGTQSLKGAVDVPQELRGRINWETIDVTLYPEGAIPDLPSTYVSMDQQARQQWLDDWWLSEKGAEAMTRYRNGPSYATGLDSERRFVFTGVMSGNYILKIQLPEMEDVDAYGQVSNVVQVPVALNSTNTNEVIDVGTLMPGATS